MAGGATAAYRAATGLGLVPPAGAASRPDIAAQSAQECPHPRRWRRGYGVLLEASNRVGGRVDTVRGGDVIGEIGHPQLCGFDRDHTCISMPAPHALPTINGRAFTARTRSRACSTSSQLSVPSGRGEGNEALQAPALALGRDWYLAIQLHNYRNGLRGVAPDDTYGATMRSAAAALPDEGAVRDVVAYINTLR